MGNTQAFEEAVRKLKTLQGDIVALSHSDDPNWKQVLVRLRRDLQMQITTLGNVINHSGFDLQDPILKRRLRDAFSMMRSNVALHQAEWPAIKIDRSDHAYTHSITAIRASNQGFQTVAALVAPNLLRE